MDYDVEAILFVGSERYPQPLDRENLSLPLCGFYKHVHALEKYHGVNIHRSLHPFLGSSHVFLPDRALSPGS